MPFLVTLSGVVLHLPSRRFSRRVEVGKLCLLFGNAVESLAHWRAEGFESICCRETIARTSAELATILGTQPEQISHITEARETAYIVTDER